MAYSGFININTFHVHMWLGEMFDNYAEDGMVITEDFVREMATDAVYEQLGVKGRLASGLASDIIASALGSVDWKELADRYNDRD